MQEVFTLEKLWQAYRDCRYRKKNTLNALRFEYNREKNLIALLQELKSRRYRISRHICFIIEDPTVREIFAADFRDRIVHHLLYNEVKKLFEADFIENSFANRIGKGTHKGVEIVKQYLKEIPHDSYYLKLDIKSFFCSINKNILFEIIKEKIQNAPKSYGWKKDILWLTEKIIYHNPANNYLFKGDLKKKALIPKEKSLFHSNGKGLPIGNLTSQFFANAYLDQLDKFIYSLGHKYYVRYVDDFIILGDKNIYKDIEKIRTFLKEKLDLKLSEKKIKFQQINKGIDFLGYFIKPDYVLVRRKVIGRLKKKKCIG
jgi:retron-type reverse transcriptase